MDMPGALSRSFKVVGVAKPATWVRVRFRGIRRVQTAHDVLRHAPCDLALAHDDQARTKSLEMIHLCIRVRSSDDLQAGIGCTSLLNQVAVLKRVRDRADQPPRSGKV